MDFDLSCITRREPCRQEGEIMPIAWKQFEAEQHDRDEAWKRLQRCEYPVDLLGRDSENAAVVQVVSSSARQSSGPYHNFQLRLVERLKGAESWDVNTIREVELPDEEPKPLNAPPETPGTRFILFFWGEEFGAPKGDATLLDDCGRIALTSKNLADLRTGIEQDFLSKWQTSGKATAPGYGR
jgi:hypothetical protein